MKKVFISMFTLLSCLSILSGCSKDKPVVHSSETQNSKTIKSTSKESSSSESTVESEEKKIDKGKTKIITDNSSQEHLGNEEINTGILARYSEDQVKNAYVWLAANGKKDISEFYVSNFPAGTPIVNTVYGEGSVNFPADVTVLSSEVVVDGSVWYSNNNDGSVTIYPVPNHWGEDVAREGKEKVKEVSQDVLNRARKINIPQYSDEETLQILQKEVQ